MAREEAYEKALDKIQEARRTNAITLDLCDNHLTALPPEIAQLTALTNLNLSDNHLTALPTGIAHLTALTALDLSYNHLTAFPPEIAQLTGLTRLTLELADIFGDGVIGRRFDCSDLAVRYRH